MVKVEVSHRMLEHFTGQLVAALHDHWDWSKDDSKPAIEQAISCLNKAEQYLLMRDGAPSIATLIPMTVNGKTCYVLQWDKRQGTQSALWLEELKTIKSNSR